MAKRRQSDRAAISAARGIPAEFITINQWRPMHCGCVHEQAFDDRDPSVTVDWHTTVACPAHAAGGANKPVWDACRNEDLRFTRCREAIKNFTGKTDEEITLEVAFTFQAATLPDGLSRVLGAVLPPDINGSQRAQIAGVLNAQFSAGAIVLG